MTRFKEADYNYLASFTKIFYSCIYFILLVCDRLILAGLRCIGREWNMDFPEITSFCSKLSVPRISHYKVHAIS